MQSKFMKIKRTLLLITTLQWDSNDVCSNSSFGLVCVGQSSMQQAFLSLLQLFSLLNCFRFDDVDMLGAKLEGLKPITLTFCMQQCGLHSYRLDETTLKEWHQGFLYDCPSGKLQPSVRTNPNPNFPHSRQTRTSSNSNWTFFSPKVQLVRTRTKPERVRVRSNTTTTSDFRGHVQRVLSIIDLGKSGRVLSTCLQVKCYSASSPQSRVYISRAAQHTSYLSIHFTQVVLLGLVNSREFFIVVDRYITLPPIPIQIRMFLT